MFSFGVRYFPGFYAIQPDAACVYEMCCDSSGGCFGAVSQSLTVVE